MTQQIKPCPFCGSENAMTYQSKEFVPGTEMAWVFCSPCGAMSGQHNEIEKSIEDWNRVSDLVHKNINQQKGKR